MQPESKRAKADGDRLFGAGIITLGFGLLLWIRLSGIGEMPASAGFVISAIYAVLHPVFGRVVVGTINLIFGAVNALFELSGDRAWPVPNTPNDAIIIGALWPFTMVAI